MKEPEVFLDPEDDRVNWFQFEDGVIARVAIMQSSLDVSTLGAEVSWSIQQPSVLHQQLLGQAFARLVSEAIGRAVVEVTAGCAASPEEARAILRRFNSAASN